VKHKNREGHAMLSQTAEYALRAVLELAAAPGDEPVRVGQLAERLAVPQNYLSKILHVLAREGVLSSGRGPRGGFRLAVAPDDLTLAEIVAPFDAIEERSRCLLGRPQCGDASPCAAHEQWKEVSGRVRRFFYETTVAALKGRGGAAAMAGVAAGGGSDGA
jgi:Rrf2 family protein